MIDSRVWQIVPHEVSRLVPMGPRTKWERNYDYTPRVERHGTVAAVHVEGVLEKRPAIEQLIWGDTSTEDLQRTIEQLADDNDVSAIVLRIDSPGGQAAGIKEAGEAIATAADRKPVVAQIDGLGASAAYWLASQASQVYATRPTDKIGSIGTLMVLYDQSKRFAEAGIEAVVLATGAFKATGVPGTEVTTEQRDYLQGLVDDTQSLFAEAVAQGRGLTAEQVAAVADGRVFSATDAERHGLINGTQSFESTLSALRGGNPTQQETQVMSKQPTPAGGSTQISGQQTDGTKLEPVKSFEQELADRRAAIEAACDGADATFIDAQLAKGATPGAALQAYVAQLKQEKAAAEQQAAEAKAGKKPPAGVDPQQVSEPGGKVEPEAASYADLKAEWDEKVHTEIKAQGHEPGTATSSIRVRAVARAARKHPELRQRLVAAANA